MMAHVEHLAALVYDLTVPDWPGEMDFYRDLARSSRSILEIACGTGRVGLRLAAEGWEMVGLDLSPHMLDIARRKAVGLANVRLAQADMRSFDLGRAFDLVIVPGHSFQFLLSIPDQLSCLRCALRHLTPQGRLVLHVDHPDLGWLFRISGSAEGSPEERAPVQLPDGGLARIRKEWTYDAATQTASVVTAFEELDAGGWVASSSLRGPVLLHVFSRYEVDHLLTRAGFAIEALYGDFLRSEFASGSSEMIWVATPALRGD